METILAEVKALVCAMYRAEEEAYAGTGMEADLRGCVSTVAGPANILWKRRGGPDVARVGQAHPGDLCLMRHLGHKFHKDVGEDPDCTLEQAVGVDSYTPPEPEEEEAPFSAPLEPEATSDEEAPGGDS